MLWFRSAAGFLLASSALSRGFGIPPPPPSTASRSSFSFFHSSSTSSTSTTRAAQSLAGVVSSRAILPRAQVLRRRRRALATATVPILRAGSGTGDGDDDDGNDDKDDRTDNRDTTTTTDFSSQHPEGPIVEYSGGGWGWNNQKEEAEEEEEEDSRADVDGRTDRRLRRRRVMVLMDCFTPYLGLYVASKIKSEYGKSDDDVVAVVYVLSDYLRIYSELTQPENQPQWDAARIPTPESVREWKRRVFFGEDEPEDGIEWVGVYSESDSGLDDAERLRVLLNVTCRDDPDVLEARRHKFYMNERVLTMTEAATGAGGGGIATVRQKLCCSKGEAKEVASILLMPCSSDHDDSGGFGSSTTRAPAPSQPALAKRAARRVVVKPFRGCGTESVYLCDTLEQVERAWEKITRTKVFGTQDEHTTVLVQEFLEGTEYAVDVVARNGTYKAAAIWRYDKRPANGAPFCYFRTQLVDERSDPNVPAIVEYVNQCLEALGVQWGISHNEVIVTDDGRGPVLVEVNCRQHNMDFAPIAMMCIGYNALDMMVEAFLGPPLPAASEDDGEEEDDDNVVAPCASWDDAYPDVPVLVASGSMVHLVNYARGELSGPPDHLESIAGLPSVFCMEVYEPFREVGSFLEPTVDIKSDAGWVQLVNDNAEELEHDYETIVGYMPTMFHVREEKEEEDAARTNSNY